MQRIKYSLFFLFVFIYHIIITDCKVFYYQRNYCNYSIVFFKMIFSKFLNNNKNAWQKVVEQLFIGSKLACQEVVEHFGACGYLSVGSAHNTGQFWRIIAQLLM